MASAALRVLGVACRSLAAVPEEPTPENVECNLIFLGLLGMIDPARPEVKVAVGVAKRAGLEERHGHRRLPGYGRGHRGRDRHARPRAAGC